MSHDEELLACVDRIVEVRGGKLGNFKGDYARFLKEREARRAQALSSLEKEGQKAAKLNEFITKFGAKATKASAAKSKAKALDKVQEKIEDLTELAGEGDLGEGPGDAKKVVLRLPNPPQGAREILIAKDLAVGYAAVGSTLVTDVNVTVTKGDRLLVIGPNGAGKSTFLKTIGGELPEMSGTVERGEGCVVGYFSQDLAQQLPAEVDALTHVLDVARKVDKSITMERARGVLEYETLNSLHADVGRGHLPAADVLLAARPKGRGARGPSRLAGAMRSLISYPRQEIHNDPVALPVNSNLYGSVVRIAADCYPLPGDEIVGIVTMGEGLVVYPVGAPALDQFEEQPERWVAMRWDSGTMNEARLFDSRLNLTVVNRTGSLSIVAQTIADFDANTSSFGRLFDEKRGYGHLFIEGRIYL